MRRLVSWIRSVSLRWVFSTNFSCFSDLLDLLFQGVLALVREAFALVQLAAEFPQLFLVFGLLLDSEFLDLQFGLAAAVCHLLLGPANHRPGLGFRVLAAQTVQELDQEKGQQEGHNGRADDGSNFSQSIHG